MTVKHGGGSAPSARTFPRRAVPRLFHGKHDGETTRMTAVPPEPDHNGVMDPSGDEAPPSVAGVDAAPSDLAAGFFLGVLVGEGSFGGDGRQPQVTVRMHTRHAELFQWLIDTFPATKLYGPYNHGGRRYYQWMARGEALRREVAPVIARHAALLDGYTRGRFVAMCEQYGIDVEAASGSGPISDGPDIVR
jgi:hypothetical protein